MGATRFLRGAVTLGVAATIAVSAAAPTTAAPKSEKPGKSGQSARPDCAGRGVPDSQISIQLYTLRNLINAPGATPAQNLENVFAQLSAIGYRQVELYNLHGLTAEQMRALLDKYHLKATAMHTSINEATWDQTLADAKTIGLKYLGAGGTPTNFTTAQQWIDYAEMLNRLGERAKQQGLTLLVHNHDREFTQVYNGQTAFDILMAHTDPRYVVFQLDLYWATFAGADPIELLERYGDRIKLFHVKDLANGTFANVGEGTIDFPAIFELAKGKVRLYSVEHDRTQAPLETAEIGFDYLDCVTF
jgi:sugar phosphate isomerase/epimerase